MLFGIWSVLSGHPYHLRARGGERPPAEDGPAIGGVWGPPGRLGRGYLKTTPGPEAFSVSGL